MNATDFNPENSAAVLARLRSLRNLALDMHDAAVDAMTDYQTFTTDDWRNAPSELIQEMFALSARLQAARLQVLLRKADELIDQIEFAE